MRKILLIDDDDLFAEFVTDAAELVNASVLTIDNGKKIEQLNCHDYDDIIIDLSVPGYDGVQILRWLKEHNCTSRIIIASGCEISVINSAGQLANAYHLNLVDCLSKPFSLDAFLKTLRSEQHFAQKTPRSIEDDELSDEEIVLALHEGIKNNEIEVYYQPKIDLINNQLLGFESLARWSFKGSPIPPDIFIPLAEQFDLIDDLTFKIVDQSLPQLAKWSTVDQPLRVAINFSARSLSKLDFPDYLSQKVETYDLLPQQIIIELTESALADDQASSLEILTRLRMKGFDLSIDDFGTGYSSVQQLQNIPFTELKIDRSFIGNFLHNPQSQAIVNSTIEMAHKLGIKVVAEGIEDSETRNALITLGCDVGQGYYFAKPLNVTSMNKWLQANNHYTSVSTQQSHELKVCLVDDDLDFISMINDVFKDKFEFSSYSSTMPFLDDLNEISPDIILLNTNLPDLDCFEIGQKIKSNVQDASILFISELDNKEQRLKAYAAGGDDFIAKPVSIGELLAKLRTLKHFQIEQKNLTQQEKSPQDVASNTTIETAQYGSLLHFFKQSFACRNYQQLAELFFSYMAELRLSACIQFRSSTNNYSLRSATQICSPMEESLFDMLANAGSLYHFNDKTMINDKHISIIIKNMPNSDDKTYPHYTHLITALIEGIEAKWVDLLRDQSATELVTNIDDILGALKNKFNDFEKETHLIIDMLILDVRASLDTLDLTDKQETDLLTTIEKEVQRVMNLSDSGKEIEHDFTKIIGNFKKTYQ